MINSVRHKIRGGNALIVPAEAKHNVLNTGDKHLRLCTIYGPPNHVHKLIEVIKAEAQAQVSREVFDGVASE